MPTWRACPHCGHRITGYDQRRDAALLKAGRCVDCRRKKTADEIAAGRWRCATCRELRAGRATWKRHHDREAASEIGGDWRPGQVPVDARAR